MPHFFIKAICILLIRACVFTIIAAQVPQTDALLEGFIDPPDLAKPRVWWHWMNGNITKEGIRKDLEWMHRVGIGGFQNFDGNMMTPRLVGKPLEYMTPEWKDAFNFATRMADSLNLDMAIASSPGWSLSGGPWVTPDRAMKKYTWSETRVEGNKPFSGILPKPYATAGAFQNLGIEAGFSMSKLPPVPEFYKDAAVVAFRIPESDSTMAELNPKITASNGSFSLLELTDGDLTNSSILKPASDETTAWIQFEFDKPETFQALSIVGSGRKVSFGLSIDTEIRTLEVSEDGKLFRTVTEIPKRGIDHTTLSFVPVRGKYFRFTFSDAGNIKIAELVLYKGARVNRFEEKAGFATAVDLASSPTPNVSESVAKADVIDLTTKMSSDGKLDWIPPAGKWVIMRLGYSLTGHQNSPASPEATGLEIDKLSAEHVNAYFSFYLNQFEDATSGKMGKNGLQYLLTDSWEAGVQNWTDSITEDFEEICGYDITPWLPVLAGYVVGSAEESDRFLWDFRKTLADLVIRNHYDQLTTILDGWGMKRYSESHAGQRALIADGMDVKRTATIPMGEMWTPQSEDSEINTVYKLDLLESASVAHLYGQNLVAAESMTSYGYNAFGWTPANLKSTADMEFACGVNQFVIHTSVHQPFDDKKPGISLGPVGQWFTRHETWAEQAGVWTKYLARSSYMLQQGRFVADIAYYYGEDNNITGLFKSRQPDIPEGYSFDFINRDALLNRLATKNGKIVTESGMAYRVLVLDENCKFMSLPVLQKIYSLVKSGAIVIGRKPTQTPSLSDDKKEFEKLIRKLWDGKGEKSTGKGKVYAEHTISDVLSKLVVLPDFSVDNQQENTKLKFVHRSLDNNVDVYWINNRKDDNVDVIGSFRIEGRNVEIWHPETGIIEKASFTIKDGLTKVPLHLNSHDAAFIVFCNKTSITSFTVAPRIEKRLTFVEGSWNLDFQPDRGAPRNVIFNSLIPWNEHTDDGIKYFSGTGVYKKTLNVPAEWIKPGTEIWLDLGNVKDLAEVVINGKSKGIVWKKPYRVNLTDDIVVGNNALEVLVTNVWINRIIGDKQPGISKKYTFTIGSPYQVNSELVPAGLIGPVELICIE